jgi:hypothetical protein
MPYMRIGGKNLFPPPLVSYLQTDGSFYPRSKDSRVAFILKTPTSEYEKMFEIKNATCSTEVEWASIAYGIAYSLEKGEGILAIENDNLGVVSSLVTSRKAKQEYARYYQYEIFKMARRSLWTGVRWMPREENKADRLF